MQGMIRTIRGLIGEMWEVKVDVTHSVWPWNDVQAGFLLTRFEVGREGNTAYERLKEKSHKGTRLVIGGGRLEVVVRVGRFDGCIWASKQPPILLPNVSISRTSRFPPPRMSRTLMSYHSDVFERMFLSSDSVAANVKSPPCTKGTVEFR